MEGYLENKFVFSNIDESYAFRGVAPIKELRTSGMDDRYEKMNSCQLSFFKVRMLNTTSHNYNRESMLHIPFNKRGLVSTQRLSIPGVPCMYLGVSSYVCWLEMGMPREEYFNVASYKLPSNMNILNLVICEMLIDGISYDVYCKGRKSTNAEYSILLLRTLLELWPLVCATPYTVLDNNRRFNVTSRSPSSSISGR